MIRPAVALADMDDHLSGDPSAQEEQHQPHRHGDHQVAASDFEFEEHGNDRDTAEHRDCRQPDPAILLMPDPMMRDDREWLIDSVAIQRTATRTEISR